ncbi:MAG: DUF4189 domain-containing protein [Actinobacteria bacterium]|nr:DUF4189 domain-containing protein [Actinomycetota bacterium]
MRGKQAELTMKIRHALLAVAAAVALTANAPAAAAAAPAAAAAIPPGPFGSFAYSPAHPAVVAKGFGTTAAKAEAAAEARCRKQATDCLPVVSFSHAYATFAVGAGKAWSWGTASTKALADTEAKNWCAAHGGAQACRVVLRATTTDPSVAAHATDLQGRICLVNAPDGVITASGRHFYGRVGWAYLKNRDTGRWEYGATEGRKPGRSARNWVRDGTWPQLVATFTKALGWPGNRSYFHRAGFYQTARCASMAAGAKQAAHAVAEGLLTHKKPFRIPGNDSLSNAARVLIAGWVATLDGPSGFLPYLAPLVHNASPDWYYANGLAGFSGKTRL